MKENKDRTACEKYMSNSHSGDVGVLPTRSEGGPSFCLPKRSSRLRFLRFFLHLLLPSSHASPSIATSTHLRSISTHTLQHRHHGCHRQILRRRPPGRPLCPVRWCRPLRVNTGYVRRQLQLHLSHQRNCIKQPLTLTPQLPSASRPPRTASS
jgi:hypothetical protein